MTFRQRMSTLGAGAAAIALVVGTAIVLDLVSLIDLEQRIQSLGVAGLSAFFAGLMCQRRREQVERQGRTH